MIRLWKIFLFIIFSMLFFGIPYYILNIESNVIPVENEQLFIQDFTNQGSLNLLRTSYANSLTIFDENHGLLNYLSELFNIEVRLMVSRNYDEFGDILKKKTADIIWGNSEHFIKNRELYNGYKVILRPVIKGQDKYRGVIIVNSNSGIKSIQDLRNRIFAFTDINSGSGYKLPFRLLSGKYGIDIYKFFADVEFLGTHEEVVKNVFLEKVDGGAVFESAPESFLEKEQVDKISIIDYTDYIYNEPILIKDDLYEKYKEKAEKSILQKLPEYVLKDLNIDGLVQATDKEYLEK